jgi:hypothetical protein
VLSWGHANFLEHRKTEVHLWEKHLSCIPVDNEGLGSLTRNTMTSKVRFRAELSVYGVERLELARA